MERCFAFGLFYGAGPYKKPPVGDLWNYYKRFDKIYLCLEEFSEAADLPKDAQPEGKDCAWYRYKRFCHYGVYWTSVEPLNPATPRAPRLLSPIIPLIEQEIKGVYHSLAAGRGDLYTTINNLFHPELWSKTTTGSLKIACCTRHGQEWNVCRGTEYLEEPPVEMPPELVAALAEYDIPLDYNHVTIEKLPTSYKTMRFHTDRCLDSVGGLAIIPVYEMRFHCNKTLYIKGKTADVTCSLRLRDKSLTFISAAANETNTHAIKGSITDECMLIIARRSETWVRGALDLEYIRDDPAKYADWLDLCLRANKENARPWPAGLKWCVSPADLMTPRNLALFEGE